MMLRPAVMQPTHVRIEQVRDPNAAASAKFPVLSPKIARNFYVTDTYMETPIGGIASAAYDRDGGDPDDMLASFRGLSAVPQEIRELLPPECRGAFELAAAREEAFKDSRGTEAESTHRREPRIDKALVPYSVAGS